MKRGADSNGSNHTSRSRFSGSSGMAGTGDAVAEASLSPGNAAKIFSKSQGNNGRQDSDAVWRARILFIVCLSCVAATLGLAAYKLLSATEYDLTVTQFESIADRALSEAVEIAKQKRWSGITMSSVIAHMHPNADAYPFVTVFGFESIVNNLLNTSRNLDMGWVPIVQVQDQSEWEDYIYDFYHTSRLPEPWPNTTAMSSFGKGIYFINPTLNSSDHRFHDTGNYNSTVDGKPTTIVAPIAQTNDGAHPVLLFNLHRDPVRRKAIDDMITCSEERAQTDASKEAKGRVLSNVDCGVITEMVKFPKFPTRGPSAAIFTPIYPVNNATKIVGFTATPIIFDQLLENTFNYKVSGVDCVLETEDQVFTFTIQEGVAYAVDYGDHHQRKYDDFRQSTLLGDPNFYTSDSPTYRLSLYPNDAFFEVYSTNNPMTATIGIVCVIFFMSLLFFLYDFLVRREFLAKQELLAAKRSFMRFVSHEVRTPLNASCMGLTLIQLEIAKALGYPSAGELQNMVAKEKDTTTTTKTSTISKVNDQQHLITNAAVIEWFCLSQEILKNTIDAVDVLSDVLNYDKIESGSLSLELAELPIWKVIEETIHEFNLTAKRKNITLGLSFALETASGDERTQLTLEEQSAELMAPSSSSLVKTLPKDMRDCKAVGDKIRIIQVVRNLVSNALKFTPDNGWVEVEAIWRRPSLDNRKLERTVHLANGKSELLHRNGSLRIDVKDSGAGMSRPQLQSLFREGIQFNASELQKGGGSGFGLFIARGIVRMHEGTLKADSEGLDKGSKFTLTLPLYYSPAAEEDETTISAEGPMNMDSSFGSRHNMTNLTCLVVDDAVTNRKLLARLLSNAGHTCELADDGDTAVHMVTEKMANGRHYDAILMDYEMPRMNGPTSAKELRRLGSDAFIVGITGNMLPEDTSYFVACGANAVLPKPVRIVDLEDLWVEHGLVSSKSNQDDI